MDRKIVSCCPSKAIAHRGAKGGKTGKTVVLPGFCKIAPGSGSVPPCQGSYLAWACAPRWWRPWAPFQLLLLLSYSIDFATTVTAHSCCCSPSIDCAAPVLRIGVATFGQLCVNFVMFCATYQTERLFSHVCSEENMCFLLLKQIILRINTVLKILPVQKEEKSQHLPSQMYANSNKVFFHLPQIMNFCWIIFADISSGKIKEPEIFQKISIISEFRSYCNQDITFLLRKYILAS